LSPGNEQPRILDPFQRAILNGLFQDEEFRAGFYLSGGTALAEFYLHHRRSEDLDIFTREDSAVPAGSALLDGLAADREWSVNWILRGRSFARAFVKSPDQEHGVKIELVTDQGTRLADPLAVDRVRVDSLLDIATNKVDAIHDREEPKDHFDLWTILSRGKAAIEDLLVLVHRKNGSFREAQFAEKILWSSSEMSFGTIRAVVPFDEPALRGYLRSLGDRLLAKYRPE
jgi:predicted nucleotidyltransferase component of viral defense system